MNPGCINSVYFNNSISMRSIFQIFIVTILLLYIQSVSAQPKLMTTNAPKPEGVKGTLAGKVTDSKTGEPISNASVYFSDLKLGGSTDSTGKFFIKNIPVGKHLIEVSHIGYNSMVENIDIPGDAYFSFALMPSVIENATVVVTGVTGATQLKKIPFSVSVMRKQDLFQNASSNIVESLVKIGGVSTMATGPAISKPVIRGLSYNR